MDIFISWSGERSKFAAVFLKRWIKQVLQETNPWVSRDIDKGKSWDDAIMNSLNKSSIGIICLTKENKNSNWIHYEAGAIAKGVEESVKVITLCIGFDPVQLEFPLGRFQGTKTEKSDIFRLITTINDSCKRPLETDDLKEVFDTNWKKLSSKFNEIEAMESPEENIQVRSLDDMVSELVENTRQLDLNLNANIGWIVKQLNNVKFNSKGGIYWEPKPQWVSNSDPTYEFKDMNFGFSQEE